MLVLGQSSFLEALGWSLLNSFWHFAVLWIVYLVLIHVLKNITASAKHAAALILMLAGIACFFANLWFLNSRPGNSFLNYTVTLHSFYISLGYDFIKNILDKVLPFLSLGYLFVIALLFIRLGRYIYSSRQLQTQGLHKMDAKWRLYVAELAQRMSISKKVKIWLSDKIDSPLIIGFLKPVILLPIALINQLTPEQIESILLHELAHIKRNDYAINFLIAVTSIIFFFNPFARLFINALRREREYCCDDWVLQFRYDPHQYASALLTLEQNRKGLISMGIAANGTHKNVLLQRVHRIMQVPYPQKNQRTRVTAFIGVVFLMTMAAFMHPQNRPLLAYDPTTLINSNTIPLQANLAYIPKEGTALLKTGGKAVVNIKKKKEIKSLMGTAHAAEQQQEEPLLEAVASDSPEQDNELSSLAAIQQTPERDFSMPEAVANQQKPVLTLENNYPYVPVSSFSYHHIEDTLYPKYKTDSYRERIAKEDEIKAQLALKKINWKKLEKELGNNKAAFEKIKHDIEQELAGVDWEKIQDESSATIQQQEQELSEKLMRDYKETQEKYLRQQALYNNRRNKIRVQAETNVEMETNININTNSNTNQDIQIHQATGQQKRKKTVVI